MVRKKKTKAAVLIISAVIVALSIVHLVIPIPLQQLGIGKGAALSSRLTYHFFHANLIHSSLNAWCLLSLAFIYDITAWELLIAYTIASSYPIDTITSFTCQLSIVNCQLSIVNCQLPTVGLSGICFALIGQVQYRVQRKLYYSTCVCAMIALGFFFPNANALLHLYCYVVGLMVGFLNSPLPHHAH